MIQKFYFLTSICDKLLGLKVKFDKSFCKIKNKSFCKIKPCEAVFVGKNFNWAQRHPILAQLLVSYNVILRTEIFLWASDNFFDSL